MVCEAESGRIVACTRILTGERAPGADGFYSSGEFDLAMLDSLPGRMMEIGRTCVAAEYRSGAVIATLWQGIASRSEEHTSELQSLMRISYAVFCLKKKKK